MLPGVSDEQLMVGTVGMESTEQLLTMLEREEISLESERSDLPAGMRA